MKPQNKVLKFMATGLAIFVVLVLPLSLLGYNVGRALFTPKVLLDVLREKLLQPEIVAEITQVVVAYRVDTGAAGAVPSITAGEQYYDEQLNTGTGGEDPALTLVLTGLNEMNYDQWVQLIRYLMPTGLMHLTAEQIIWGIYDWIDGPNTIPVIRFPTQLWKQNVSEVARPALEAAFMALPQCTPVQMGHLDDPPPGEPVPICRPPEPDYTEALDGALEILPSLLLAVPNEHDLATYVFESSTPEELQRMDNAKRWILRFRFILLYGWLAVAGLYVLVIPLGGGRSKEGWLRWAGWPLLVAGSGVIVIGVAIKLLSYLLLNSVENMSLPLPFPIVFPLLMIMDVILTVILVPMGLEGAVMILLGAGMLGGARMLAKQSGEQPEEGALAVEAERPRTKADYAPLRRPKPNWEGEEEG